MQLRDYQQECIDTIAARGPGRWLAQLATGLGKTVIFSHIPRQGRVLILSHRDELVHQPLRYYDCSTGVEMAAERSNGEEVVSASVQSLVHRLDKFAPDAFDTIICDEAHHAAARSYRTIFDHFRPRQLLGFTATPNRADSVRLNDVFDDIIFQRDLRWGIQHGYLSDIYCRRVNIGYDLRGVHTRGGDYAPGELEQAMDGTADAIAEVYAKMATGATLIFAVSVAQAHEIADKIPGAVAVTGETKDRADIIRRFTSREIPCLVNCMVFTEGTDMPLVETVIVARPTQSDSLYTQMVGRGLRLCEGKDKLNLIDCVGVTGRASLCTAPSLLGISLDEVPTDKRDTVEGMLFELEDTVMAAADCPESWIRNVSVVDLWAKGQKYDLHGVNWFKLPNGDLYLSIPDGKMRIPAADELGRTFLHGEHMPMQQALDRAYMALQEHYEDSRYIWDTAQIKRWGNSPASEKQKQYVARLCRKKYPKFDPEALTKAEASQVINRLVGGKS